jgi:hypothetical protein
VSEENNNYSDFARAASDAAQTAAEEAVEEGDMASAAEAQTIADTWRYQAALNESDSDE